MGLGIRSKFAHEPAHNVAEPADPLHGGIDLQEPAVDRAPRLVLDHFRDVEALVHCVEQHAVLGFRRAQRRLRAGAFNRRPRALGDLTDQVDVFGRPMSGGYMVDAKTRNPASILDKRNTDACSHFHRGVGCPLGLRQTPVGACIVDHDGLPGTRKFGRPLNIAQPEVPDKRRYAVRVGPVDHKGVAVLVDLVEKCPVHREMLAQHPECGGLNLQRVAKGTKRIAELEQEGLPLLVSPAAFARLFDIVPRMNLCRDVAEIADDAILAAGQSHTIQAPFVVFDAIAVAAIFRALRRHIGLAGFECLPEDADKFVGIFLVPENTDDFVKVPADRPAGNVAKHRKGDRVHFLDHQTAVDQIDAERCLIEQRLELLFARQQRRHGAHPFGCLDPGDEYATDSAVFVSQRVVRKGEPGGLCRATAVGNHRKITPFGPARREHLFRKVTDAPPQLRPALAGRRSKQPGMPGAIDPDGGIVAELDQVRTPPDVEGKAESSIRSTTVLRLCGQPAGGPSGVTDQSKARILRAISPSPAGHMGCSKAGKAPFPARSPPLSPLSSAMVRLSPNLGLHRPKFAGDEMERL